MRVVEPSTIRSPRDTRLNLRTTAREEALIREAATASHQTVTDFVLRSATAAAEHVLADRRSFSLSAEQWAEFAVLLDRPVVHKPRLAKLLAERDPFED